MKGIFAIKFLEESLLNFGLINKMMYNSEFDFYIFQQQKVLQKCIKTGNKTAFIFFPNSGMVFKIDEYESL